MDSALLSGASAIAASLAGVKEEELVDAVSLLLSLRPELHGPLVELVSHEPSARCVGEITCFYPDKQFGFIKSQDVEEQFGIDTFLSSLEIGAFGVGSTVSFSVAVNKDGKPQARLLDHAVPGTSEMPKKRTAISDQAAMGGPALKVPRWEAAIGSAEKRYSGTITCFYPAKHYGFIQSDEAMAEFGMDTFLSEAEIGDFTVGSEITFHVALNKNGNPQARDLRALRAPQVMRKGGKGEQKGTWHQSGSWPPHAAGPGRYIGFINAFHADRRYGFIKSDEVTRDFGIDAFLSDKEIGGFTNDCFVSFQVRENHQGKPQAFDLRPAPGGR